jgi:hypothetical protein
VHRVAACGKRSIQEVYDALDALLARTPRADSVSAGD